MHPGNQPGNNWAHRSERFSTQSKDRAEKELKLWCSLLDFRKIESHERLIKSTWFTGLTNLDQNVYQSKQSFTNPHCLSAKKKKILDRRFIATNFISLRSYPMKRNHAKSRPSRSNKFSAQRTKNRGHHYPRPFDGRFPMANLRINADAGVHEDTVTETVYFLKWGLLGLPIVQASYTVHAGRK